ncbi:uncharacterized protein LOC129610621 [Condylostylus longicornis]|uniref:uncharacterized protein LOC129610621 n=1 Tax=Condylostylus longicornis TaxID=2530218 RepID=UPI00244E5A74|nr:uncharacterized protein LOC129610621 [Condylostylus longicornis]
MKGTDKFIARVETYGELYDNNNPNSSNSKRKDEIWESLSNEFNCDAKRKWHTLRDRYVREKKKSRTLEGFESRWYYYHQMDFLDKYIKSRRRVPRNKFSVFVPENEECDETKEFEEGFEYETKNVKEFFDDFCTTMTDLKSSESSEGKHKEYSKTDSFTIHQKSKRPKAQQSVSIQQNILKVLQMLQEQIENVGYTNNHDEDTIFIELVVKKMRKMSPTEKSAFQEKHKLLPSNNYNKRYLHFILYQKEENKI